MAKTEVPLFTKNRLEKGKYDFTRISPDEPILMDPFWRELLRDLKRKGYTNTPSSENSATSVPQVQSEISDESWKHPRASLGSRSHKQRKEFKNRRRQGL